MTNVRTSKYKTILAKDYIANWSEEAFVVRKVEILFRDVISDLNGEKIVETFHKKKKKNKL